MRLIAAHTKLWFSVALWLLLALGLSACAVTTPTPYQAKGTGHYGYSEFQAGAQEARVIFAGNPLTREATVQDYALFRAAELASARGFPAFIVLKNTTERLVEVLADYPSRPGFGAFARRPFYHDPYWGRSWYPGFYGPPTYSRSERYTTVLDIRFASPEDLVDPPGRIYHTEETLNRLRPRLVLSQTP